jgi:hypothetical protein
MGIPSFSPWHSKHASLTDASAPPIVDLHWQVMHCATLAGRLGSRDRGRKRIKRRFVRSLDAFERDGAVHVAEWSHDPSRTRSFHR